MIPSLWLRGWVLTTAVIALFAAPALAGSGGCESLWAEEDGSNSNTGDGGTIFEGVPFEGNTENWRNRPDFEASGNQNRERATLSSGIYYFDAFETGNNFDLVVDDGPVTIFIDGDFTLGNGAELNIDGNPQDLVVMVRGAFATGTGLGLKGFVYASEGIDVDNVFDIEGALSSAGDISLGGGNTNFEPRPELAPELRVDDVCRPMDEAAFNLDVPGQASVCEPAPVTLSVIDEDGNRVTDYTGTVSLNTSSGAGVWALEEGDGSLSMSGSDDGQAEYDFGAADEGAVSLSLENRLADTLVIGATDGEISGNSSPLLFRENAFLLSLDADPLGSDVVAGRPHQVHVRAVRQDDSGECGLVQEYDGSVALQAWVEREGADPGGESPALNGDALPNEPPGGTNVSLQFNGGEAGATLDTVDVGLYRLQLLDQNPDRDFIVDEDGQPRPISGAGERLRPRPFGFDVQVPNNPSGEVPDDPPFTAAGRPFEVELRAVLWRAEADADGSGLPDGHDDSAASPADLSQNERVPSFALEEDRLNLTASTHLDTNQFADPLLSLPAPLPGFQDGVTEIADVRYPEVGAIRIEAAFEGDYLGVPATVIGAITPVGRFHPELFTVFVDDDGAFADYCETSFVYTGQSFGYERAPRIRIEPRAFSANGEDGDITANYQGEWARLNAEQVVLAYPEEDAVQSLEVSRVSASDGVLSEGLLDGELDFRPQGDEFEYVKNFTARIDPFDTALSITLDSLSDGDASVDPERTTEGENPLTVTPGPIEKRFGRLHLSSAFGPEDVPLGIPLETQYWEVDRFRRNFEDSPASSDAPECLSYNPAEDVELDPDGVAVNESESRDVALFMGRPEAQADRIVLVSQNDPVDPMNNTVQVSLPVPEWLKDVTQDDELVRPSASASFGVYRGHDRIIYWREVR